MPSNTILSAIFPTNHQFLTFFAPISFADLHCTSFFLFLDEGCRFVMEVSCESSHDDSRSRDGVVIEILVQPDIFFEFFSDSCHLPREPVIFNVFENDVNITIGDVDSLVRLSNHTRYTLHDHELPGTSNFHRSLDHKVVVLSFKITSNLIHQNTIYVPDRSCPLNTFNLN